MSANEITTVRYLHFSMYIECLRSLTIFRPSTWGDWAGPIINRTGVSQKFSKTLLIRLINSYCFYRAWLFPKKVFMLCVTIQVLTSATIESHENNVLEYFVNQSTSSFKYDLMGHHKMQCGPNREGSPERDWRLNYCLNANFWDFYISDKTGE